MINLNFFLLLAQIINIKIFNIKTCSHIRPNHIKSQIFLFAEVYKEM